MKWFKHDSNANADAKLEKLRIRFGLEGYGLYWYCLELIAGSVDNHNLTFCLEHDSEVISYRTGVNQQQVETMISFMVDLGLFENDRGVISCLKMAARTDEYTQKLLKNKKTPDSVETKSELIEENRIEEKRLEKDIATPQPKKKRFTPPTIEQCIEHCGNKVESEKFILFYESKGWMVGKNKMVNWKSALTRWINNNYGNNNQQLNSSDLVGEDSWT